MADTRNGHKVRNARPPWKLLEKLVGMAVATRSLRETNFLGGWQRVSRESSFKNPWAKLLYWG